MNRWIIISIAIVGLLAIQYPAMGCGPFFPDTYLLGGQEADVLELSRLYFRDELCRIAGIDQYKTVMHSSRTYDWESTAKGDREDLPKAMKRESTYAVQKYREMRQAMIEFYNGENSYFDLENREKREHFDLEPYQSLWKELPQEFVLYTKGANDYRAHYFEDAIKDWKLLLELPECDRQFRSTWAAFMLGKAFMFVDMEKSIPYFEKTRKLAEQGFHDSLNLAKQSNEWQAMADWHLGRHHRSFRRYIDSFLAHPYYDTESSLRMIIPPILHQNPIEEAIVADPLCREVITSWLMAGRYAQHGREWLKAIQQNNVTLESKEGDRLAWVAYKMGEFDAAQEWLSRVETHSPIGHWILAKLLLRKGDIEEAMNNLQEVRILFPEQQANKSQAELGVLRLGRQEYIEALDLFARSGYWEDAAYIAERVITIGELKNYLQNHRNDLALQSVPLRGSWKYQELSVWQGLNYLLARRLVRMEAWDEAGEYMPENLKPVLKRYIHHRRNGNHENLPASERASHLYECGVLVRNFGMALLGTEVEPDWRMYEGAFDRQGGSEFRAKGKSDVPQEPQTLYVALTASEQEKERVKQYAPSPNRRFHYRKTAIDLMWQAAKLAPDNDPFTARALYKGGQYAIGIHDFEEADKFYKSLVKRCGNLPIGQAAQKANWLPKNGEKLLQ